MQFNGSSPQENYAKIAFPTTRRHFLFGPSVRAPRIPLEGAINPALFLYSGHLRLPCIEQCRQLQPPRVNSAVIYAVEYHFREAQKNYMGMCAMQSLTRETRD